MHFLLGGERAVFCDGGLLAWKDDLNNRQHTQLCRVFRTNTQMRASRASTEDETDEEARGMQLAFYSRLLQNTSIIRAEEAVLPVSLWWSVNLAVCCWAGK